MGQFGRNLVVILVAFFLLVPFGSVVIVWRTQFKSWLCGIAGGLIGVILLALLEWAEKAVRQ